MSSVEPVSARPPDNGVWRSEQFRTWLDRRMPPANAITLSQKSIFILPTREGLMFAVLVVFMVLAGINYQNSLVYALAFLLASLFMVSILHTYRNLAGLTLQAGPVKAAFAGEDAEFIVILSRLGERTHEALLLGWDKQMLQGADLLEEEEDRVKLYVPTRQRGVMNPGRLLIQTYYPVGLFRSWSWVDLDMSTLVYPYPVAAGPVPGAPSSAEEGEMLQREGAEDFYGLRQYHSSDPPRHVAWKSYARTEELLTKQYASYADRRVWLDWELLTGMEAEARLSRLCYWVLQLAATTNEYGLRLPGLEIAPGRGEAHRDEVLKALAIFEVGR
ncbi:MAG: DUF58 domain-containing protein [Proteobacteria bacterium]|nr:DUF58 domain-containing protein [Pseudomonadota bacterium]MDA1299291.1 DUF58 domain-containing protein [Pseudomonadota bacterium]